MDWLQPLTNWLHLMLDTNWAYLVLFVWTILEGETCLILAGAFAADGKPNLSLCILAAFAGSLAGDQMWFFIGRIKGQAILARRPSWQMKAQRVFRILHRHGTALVLGFRFLYGLRNVTPFAIGISNFPVRRYVVLNSIGAAIWAVSFGMLGYLFGAAMATYLEKSEHRLLAILAVAAVIFTVWLIRTVYRGISARRSLRSQNPPASQDVDAVQ